jgi:hypothetical protein
MRNDRGIAAHAAQRKVAAAADVAATRQAWRRNLLDYNGRRRLLLVAAMRARRLGQNGKQQRDDQEPSHGGAF